MSAWQASAFKIATPNGVRTIDGYVHLGLGLWLMEAGSPKGRRKPKWSLTHLGTGHMVATLDGNVSTAFPIATEIAEAGDWTFDGLTGYKNQFPDCAEKTLAIIARHAKIAHRRAGVANSSEVQAREIALGAAA